MITKEDLEASFLEDQNRLAKLQEQLDLLTREKLELERIVQSEQILLQEKFGKHLNQDVKPIPKTLFIRNKFKNKSTQDAAFNILIENENTPTHIRDIFKCILEGGKDLKNQSSVGVALNRDSRFIKVRPNTFAITEEEYKKTKEREVRS